MKLIKKIIPLFITVLFVLSCSQQKARRPISQSSGTFMRESADRNKKLISSEESKIDIGMFMKVKMIKILYDLEKEILHTIIMKLKI